MIPWLYPSSTSIFDENNRVPPLGYLSDALECTVTEEINGEYSLTMKYRYDGVHNHDIEEGVYILATHDDSGNMQPFRVEKVTKKLDGTMEIYATHLSYWLTRITVFPFTATSLSDALSKIPQNYMTTMYTAWFSYQTNIVSNVPYNSIIPRTVRSLLAGEEGSLLDVYGQGELEFDTYSVRFLQARGEDRGLVIQYGKNMTAFNAVYNRAAYYNAIVPYWYGDVTVEYYLEGVVTYQTRKELVMGTFSGTPTDPDYIVKEGAACEYALPVDVTDMFDSVPTDAQVRAAGKQWLDANKPYDVTPEITVSFDANWQIGNGDSPFIPIRLGDVVKVIDRRFYLNDNYRIKKIEYDVLRDRYNKVTVGTLSPSLYDTIRKISKGKR